LRAPRRPPRLCRVLAGGRGDPSAEAPETDRFCGSHSEERMATTPPRLAIVIVNWNAGLQLRACVDSIAAAARTGFVLSEVVIVDNASCDGSADHLAPADLPLRLVRNSENRGFAAACNQGAAGLDPQPDYLLFLNPDTRLQADSLRAAVAFMERRDNERYAVYGCRTVDESGRTARSCSRFPGTGTFVQKILGLDYLLPRVFRGLHLAEFDHESDRDVDHVIAAFYFVRSARFRSLGGFDERFFVYLEDLDFSLRVHLGGERIRYSAASSIVHKGGGTSEAIPAERLAYALDSRLRYCDKHLSRTAAALVRVGTLYVEPLTRRVFAAIRGDAGGAADVRRAMRLLHVRRQTAKPGAGRRGGR
jgi:N-acetylglucosaminyl-diphospho-decaprenol L-rhamnosyltransferase